MNIATHQRSQKGFSLIELMVAMGILTVLMLMLTVLLDQVQKSFRFSESRISQFREARVAFDLMAKNMSQASLNTYWDTVIDSDGLVKGYEQTSELHFITLNNTSSALPSTTTQQPMGHGIFFQAPLGFSTEYRNLNNLFNARGYFVAWGSDERFKPSFVQAEKRYRFRLMEFRPPAEANQVFEDGKEEREQGVDQNFDKWYKQSMAIGKGNFESHLNPLAENILAIIISPRDTLEASTASREQNFSKIAPNYAYDSNDKERITDPNDEFSSYAQQVPPLIRLTMVAIDEGTAVRMSDGSNVPHQLSSALTGLFQRTDRFNEDVQEISDRLNAAGVDYKIFSTMVMLRSAKWTGN